MNALVKQELLEIVTRCHNSDYLQKMHERKGEMFVPSVNAKGTFLMGCILLTRLLCLENPFNLKQLNLINDCICNDEDFKLTILNNGKRYEVAFEYIGSQYEIGDVKTIVDEALESTWVVNGPCGSQRSKY